jgi:hypothetical protein
VVAGSAGKAQLVVGHCFALKKISPLMNTDDTDKHWVNQCYQRESVVNAVFVQSPWRLLFFV